MKIKPYNPRYRRHFAVTPEDTNRQGVETLPDHIIKANLDVMRRFKLLKLIILLMDGPVPGQCLSNLPNKFHLDMSTAEYRIVATQDGETWPSKRAKAIRAFMGGI